MQMILTRPDDWHLHLRDGRALTQLVPHSARQFARAIVMPNLRPPVRTARDALAYRERIQAAVPDDARFEPLMTLYLTDQTTAGHIAHAGASACVTAGKLYPAGTTTLSEAGVTTCEKLFPIAEALERHDVPLLVHGEVNDPDVDIFDREKVFLDRWLAPLLDRFPRLRIVLEHISSRRAVDFVTAAPPTLAATITAHHLLLNRNAMLARGIRPHLYCLPILKRESDRVALVEAATSGNPKFFLGTDSAPHARSAKESACGCAGSFTAPIALALYAEVFEHSGALPKLEAFASFHGADFYRLPRNRETVTLLRDAWEVPASYPLGGGTLVPLFAGKTLSWRVAQSRSSGNGTGASGIGLDPTGRVKAQSVGASSGPSASSSSRSSNSSPSSSGGFPS
jgi:dihydroorotase